MDSQPLSGFPLLVGLSDEQLSGCAAGFREIEVLSDHNLAREGGDAYAFFIVLEGQLDVHVNFEVLGTLHRGDFFGEIGLESDGKRTAHVASRGRVRLAKMMAWDYQKMVEQHPVLRERIAAVAAERSGEPS